MRETVDLCVRGFLRRDWPRARNTRATACIHPTHTHPHRLCCRAQVLRQASEALHERGLHAHALIKTLLPENTTGKVDAAGLQEVFARLDLPLTDARAARFMK